MLHTGAEVIAASPAVDVSEAVRYFMDGTPEEGAFSVADVPLSGGIDWLVEGTGGVFVETSAPPEDGLPWATLLARDSGIASVMEHASRAGAMRGVDSVVETGDPGLALLNAGLVERAGVFVFFDNPVGDELRRSFYEHLFGERFDLEDLSGVLQMMCFAEVETGYGEDSRRTLIEPAEIWYLPVNMSGYGVEMSAGSDELMMVAPGVGELEDFEDVMDDLFDAQRPLLLSVLFALGCLGSATGTGPSSARLEAAGTDACGEVGVLSLGGLSSLLDRRGDASDLGLSHALTVCRAEFEASR